MANFFTNIKDPNKIDWQKINYVNPATLNQSTQPKLSQDTGTGLPSKLDVFEKKIGSFFTNLANQQIPKALEPSPQLKQMSQNAKTYAEQNQQGIKFFTNVRDILLPKPESPEEALKMGLFNVGTKEQPLYVDPTGAVGGIEDVSKNIFKSIAKEVKPVEIVGWLKKLGGIADDLIPELSQKLSKLGKESEVETIINKYRSLEPVKAITPIEAHVAQKARGEIKLARDEQIYKLKTEIEMAEEALSSEKAAQLEKYASNKGMIRALPEMTGQKGKGIFRQTGDQLAESAGFKDIYEADNAFEKYVNAKEILKEKKIELKTVIQKSNAEVAIGKLESVEEFKAFADEKQFLDSISKDITTELRTQAKTAKKEEKELLSELKNNILQAIEREKNAVRQNILNVKNEKNLDNTTLLRLKEKNGIEDWSKATKEQLKSVLEDLKGFQKDDKLLSLTQVESMKEFGINNLTTKREASTILGDVTKWKDRNAPLFNFFKTIDQKITNTAGADAENVRNILTRPREKAVKEMFHEEIALKTEMRDMLNTGKINTKQDRALIMRYGEGRISLTELKEATSKWKEIVNADNWFRKQYDDLLESTNKELSRFYDDSKLIPKRKDYYTHFQELGKIWDMSPKGGDISPVLEQISEFTKPNRRFNPFGLKRKGGMEFVEDAGKAFEAYLNPTLNNKYLTESIVRHRTVADILAHKTLETKDINQFIHSLRVAADNLAGKTNPFDRALMDSVLGRKNIQRIISVSNKMGKNRIIGNVGSAIMQISGIPNSVLKNNSIRTSKGFLTQALSPFLGADDPLLKSSFLLTRYGEKGLKHGETVIPTIVQKGEKLLSVPFELIEKNVTKAIWRASFDNAYSQGFRGAEVIQKADEITASVVGSRAIGEKALAFESGVLSLPLQFQLEVNTHAQLWGEEFFGKIFKDPLKAARAGIETSVTLFLMNTMFERFLGRTPLPDPIRAIKDASEADTWPEKVGRLAGEGLSTVAGGQFIANTWPLSDSDKRKFFGRSEVGIYPGGIPIASALQGAFKSPVNFVYDFVLPYGGGQLKKIIEGIESLDKMGSYNSAGKLQFPINQNEWLQVVLFGRYSTPEAKEYFDKQRLPMTDKQTVEYFLRTQKGEDPQSTYNDIMKERIKGEYERQLVKAVVKKIKEKPNEGFALVELWKKQGILTNAMEKDIIEAITK